MKKTGKLILIIFLVLACVMLVPGKVNAGLQANKGGTSLASKTAGDFFELIRSMETGTLGKASIEAADGIDCHMAKNTEWGTAVILTACRTYGKAPTNTAVTNVNNSTTGNESGVYQMYGGLLEYTAHYGLNYNSTTTFTSLFNAVETGKGKYVNTYSGVARDYIDGDGMVFSGANPDPTWPVLFRGYGSIYGSGVDSNGNSAGGYCGGAASGAVGSRAVVVNGSGL